MKNIILSLIAAGMLLLVGCSETKDSAPAAQTAVTVHGIGFADPASANFHAKAVQAKNYELKECRSCHGADYAGGITGQSCKTCHSKPGGPENCTTCHGGVNAAPPKDLTDHISPTFRGVGAHQKHVLGGSLGAAVACADCHSVPAALSSAGHIDASAHAEVRFDSTSAMFASGSVVTQGAATVTCNNTYCHGNFNGGNLNNTMTWTDTTSAAVACGTCHGDNTKATNKEKAFPKTNHSFVASTSNCETCHADVVSKVNNDIVITTPSRHMNGKLN